MSYSDVVLEIVNGIKVFGTEREALVDVNLQVTRGECVALLGASGSGKSTLLRSLCGLELLSGSDSSVLLNGEIFQRGGRLSASARRLRRRTAIIFQQFNLVGRKSLLDNVLTGALARLPLWRAVVGRFTVAERRVALDALHAVGLLEHWNQRASTLSGGQQQRAAIARALVQGAQVLLADEPVASLDPESTERVMKLLTNMTRVQGLTLVVSLHDVELARRYCPRVVALKAGRIVYDGESANLTEALLTKLYGAQAAAALCPTEITSDVVLSARDCFIDQRFAA